MKKIIATLLIGALVMIAVAPAASAANERGGVVGFFAGCCFGIRSGAAYNDGKDLHWREWVLLIPIAGIVVAIMNGVDGMGGITTSELAAQYGSTYY